MKTVLSLPSTSISSRATRKCWWNGAYVRSSTSVPFGCGWPSRQRRGHHDAGGPDLALDVAVLIEPPVDQVLVVGDGDVERDRQPAHPAHLGAGVVVDVLPQHGVVFLVDADGVGDGVRLALAVVQHGVQIADLAEAVATELQRRRHEAEAPLADVECGAPVVVLGRVAVGHDHLGKRHPVCHRAVAVTVAVANRVQRHALAVVEPDRAATSSATAAGCRRG